MARDLSVLIVADSVLRFLASRPSSFDSVRRGYRTRPETTFELPLTPTRRSKQAGSRQAIAGLGLAKHRVVPL